MLQLLAFLFIAVTAHRDRAVAPWRPDPAAASWTLSLSGSHFSGNPVPEDRVEGPN
jgi:hypothetical protein